MRKFSCMVVAALLLAACAPSTAQGVRALGPGRATSFVSPEGYQAVYRKVLNQARNCYQTGLITAQMVVQGDIYTDTKSGTVTVALHGGLGVDTYQVYDITAIDDRQTKVVGYFTLGSTSEYSRQLWGWVMQNSTECLN